MKREFQFKIVPSPRVSSTVETLAERQTADLRWIFKVSRHGKIRHTADSYILWVAYSAELDHSFVEHFRKVAPSDTRLLVFNEGQSSDTVASRLTELQIRSSQRFYIADLRVCRGYGSGKTECAGMLLQRLASILAAKDNPHRVLDATIENGTLRVVAPDFRRLEVPISKIPSLQNADPVMVGDFTIDSDGSFIYWPKLDAHLGWEQLEGIVNPESALRARQRTREFNARYGHAVRSVREEAGFRYSDVSGISEKQLRRIERGECRLTSNAAEILAAAHELTPNQYLDKLAKTLE